MNEVFPTCPNTNRCLAKLSDKYNRYPGSEQFNWKFKYSPRPTAVYREITQPRSPNIIQCFSHNNGNVADEIKIYASKTHNSGIVDIFLQ